MSEVQNDGALADAEQNDALIPPALPNFSCAPKPGAASGENRQAILVSYSVGSATRTIEVVRPDLGDQLDLAELAGAQTINVQWLGLAMAAVAVKTMDGVPQPSFRNKEDMKRTLRKLGEDGLRAVNYALAQGSRAEPDPASVAKNSSGTPGSAI